MCPSLTQTTPLINRYANDLLVEILPAGVHSVPVQYASKFLTFARTFASRPTKTVLLTS